MTPGISGFPPQPQQIPSKQVYLFDFIPLEPVT